MKQVDFYLISNRVVDAKFKLASRLANKLQRMEQTSLLITSDANDGTRLDEILWSFSDTSFVAHERLGEADAQSRVVIAHQEELAGAALEPKFDVLINLGNAIPMVSHHHFDRIAEIVEHDDEAKQAARVRYKGYQSESFELKTHDITL